VLGLVTLLVPDYDAGLAFFVGGLGWRCVEDEDQGRKRWVVVAPEAGGTALVLARPTTQAQEAALGQQAGDRVGFFLMTRDFDRDAARIVSAGGTFLEAPRDETYGRLAQWRDPWGNLWDLIAPA
jgi:predicted enzyme related to lactoylglutathione lyase